MGLKEHKGDGRIKDCTPYIAEAAALLRERMGCCLHIVICDANISDSHVRWCLERAVAAGHERCRRLAAAMLVMSRTQRAKITDHAGTEAFK